MNICENCKRSFNKGYKNKCWACYHGLLKNPNFKRRPFKRELIGTSCEQCSKIRQKESDIENKICRLCYQKNRFKVNPDLHEKHKKLCRDYRRKEKGIDVDLPLLIASPGTGYIGANGYKKICKLELRGHPNADKKGRMFEHTYVMSQYLGRPLRKKELIHHKNGIRHDNRIENLELCHIGQPCGQRVEDKIEWCIDFLNQYGYDVIKK